MIIEVMLIAGNSRTTATIAHTKIITPKMRHLFFLMPISPKIPARSIRTPTVAPARPPTSSSIISLIAVRGAKMPQTI